MPDKPELRVVKGGGEKPSGGPKAYAEPLVQDGTFFEVLQGNRVVGTVSATFDFADLPEEHHSLAFGLITSARRRIRIPEEGLQVANPHPEYKRGGVILLIRAFLRSLVP